MLLLLQHPRQRGVRVAEVAHLAWAGEDDDGDLGLAEHADLGLGRRRQADGRRKTITGEGEPQIQFPATMTAVLAVSTNSSAGFHEHTRVGDWIFVPVESRGERREIRSEMR